MSTILVNFLLKKIMSRLDARLTILDLIKLHDFKKRFIDNIDKIITQYSGDEFINTLKLVETARLIDLRCFLSKFFLDLFQIGDDLCLKYRRGENINVSLSNDIFILAHSIVDKKISEKINNIFNLNVKPLDFLNKKEQISKKINFIFNTVNLDKTMSCNNSGNELTSDEKLDKILKLVAANKEHVETLSMTVNTLKQSHDDLKTNLKAEIRKVCLEYIPTSNSTASIDIDMNDSNSKVDLYDSTRKKRKLQATGTINLANQESLYRKEHINNDFGATVNKNTFYKRSTSVFGSNDNTGIKMGIIPFYAYIGNVDLSESDQNLKSFLESKRLTVINLSNIQTRSVTSKAYKLTIPKDEAFKLMNHELWPKGMLINKYTFPKHRYYNDQYKSRYNANNYQNSFDFNRDSNRENVFIRNNGQNINVSEEGWD